MAASMDGVLHAELQKNINSCTILVVGAGGIGCELIKDLVLTGFHDIELIDLDTIDVSNLNRQFLFRKEHVGKSKAKVARESALRFNPNAKIIAHHDSIMNPDYGVDYFKKFALVMNALDNRAARNHVNRMCLAADIPLVESGTAGYLGQVTVIKKGETECYECQPKPAQKTFPGCTIRNTPSEPIHCIVWAKHLFNQLFGEEDPDQDVSPDTEDPEAAGDAGAAALQSEAKDDTVGGLERKSTRAWAQDTDYDAMKLFNKFFRDDIKYLLSMANLWKKRRPPTPLDWDHLPDTVAGGDSATTTSGIQDQKVWSMQECARHFKDAVAVLKVELSKQGSGPEAMLVWDKDDEAALNFVTSAANVRAQIFGIGLKSKFDVKSMAGNIIPAIATTNAIIAGLIVMEGIKLLSGNFKQCKTVYLNRQPNPRKKLLVPCELDKPNPKCYVCSEKPEVTVRLNTTKVTVRTLEEKIIKGNLGMVAPDVEIDDGKGTILISSEEGETEENMDKMMSHFGIQNGTRLKCDDFLQVYVLNINILHVEKLEDEQEFDVVGDVSELQAQAEGATTAAAASNGDQKMDDKPTEEADDDLLLMEEAPMEDGDAPPGGRKRKLDEVEKEETIQSAAKKAKLGSTGKAESAEAGDEEDIVVL